MAQNVQDNDTSPLVAHHLKRLNLIVGKGGVGRSTIAAVLAKAAAADGKRVLLAELQDDHASDSVLARNFELPHFQIEPAEISPNLWAMSLSPATGQSLFLNSFLKIHALSQSILKNKGVQWFLEGAPAFREMGFFYHLLLQLRKKHFDCIILDLPATGHVVGLAKLPRILLRLIPIGPIAERLKEGQSYFYDTQHTAAWIVTLPQTLPVSESIELKNALVSETIPIGGFILNRAPFNPFTRDEVKEAQIVLQSSESRTPAMMFERIRRLNEATEKLCEETKNSSESLALFVAQEVLKPMIDLLSTTPLQRFKC